MNAAYATAVVLLAAFPHGRGCRRDSRRYSDRTKYATQTKLRELVRRERRVELAFEGHRLFDIRRWRIAEQVMNGEVYGATPPGADDRYLAQTRVFNPNRDYLWPSIAPVNHRRE